MAIQPGLYARAAGIFVKDPADIARLQNASSSRLSAYGCNYLVINFQAGINVADMAEAIAVVGLVASIASLVDLSAKVVTRLQEFTSKTADIPESFRSLWVRLPLLTASLRDIESQANIGHVSDDTAKALKSVVDNTSEHVSTVHICLSKIFPSDSASRSERMFKALKSLAKEDQVQQASEKIHKNIEFLILDQTTRGSGAGYRILKTLSKSSVTPDVSSKSHGVYLSRAPQIADDAFVGRTKELQQLQEWLLPKGQPNRQRIVSIMGMGGVGKTQLSLAHVRECTGNYSSVFWVNAKDETSLKRSMTDLNAIVFPESAGSTIQSTDDENIKISRVRQWLSEIGNDRWLLIFDNYDNPCLPGMGNRSGYDIKAYFPHRAHGSILITTRSPRLLFAKQLPLGKLDNIQESLAILEIRSGRKVEGGKIKYSSNKERLQRLSTWQSKDTSAQRLALRLDGFPLALATAGAYLSQSADGFDN